MHIRQYGHHEPSPHVCMSMYPESESCWLKTLFAMATPHLDRGVGLDGQGAAPQLEIDSNV